jgi:asparagine synthase (glutamine-hydrolysing)
MLKRHRDCASRQGDDLLRGSLQAAEPFLDRKLVEFMIAVPPEFQIRPNLKKLLLREALKDILPAEIRSRRDKVVAGSQRCRAVAAHRNELHFLITRLPETIAGYINQHKLLNTIDRVAQGDSVYEPALHAVLSMVVWAHRLPWSGGILPTT